MNIYSRIIGIVILSFLISCGKSINPKEVLPAESKLILTINGSDNSGLGNLKVKMIEPNSDVYKKFRNWLEHNTNGWEIAAKSSWAIPDISLIAKHFKLLIYKDGVVLGFADNTGNMKEYTKKVDESDFSFFKE